jgi:hypothetical protein
MGCPGISATQNVGGEENRTLSFSRHSDTNLDSPLLLSPSSSTLSMSWVSQQNQTVITSNNRTLLHPTSPDWIYLFCSPVLVCLDLRLSRRIYGSLTSSKILPFLSLLYSLLYKPLYSVRCL